MNAEAMRNEIGAIVRRAVAAQRRNGMKMDEAQTVAGRRLGLTARRVRAYLYGEVFKVPAHEAVGIVDGWRRSAEARIADLEAEIADEKQQIARVSERCRDVSDLLRAASDTGR